MSCSCGDECRWELRSGPALDLELARQREERDALEVIDPNAPVDLVDDDPNSSTYGSVIHTDQATIYKINMMISALVWGGLSDIDDGTQ